MLGIKVFSYLCCLSSFSIAFHFKSRFNLMKGHDSPSLIPFAISNDPENIPVMENMLTEKETQQNKFQSFLKLPGFFVLNFVAILWGTQHVCIKTSLELYHSTSLLNFWRFILSTILFSPSLFSTLSNKKSETIRSGFELGLWTFLGFACQAIGLETTTASRSAFLLYLNVKFVPFLAAIFLRRQITTSTWGSALLAFCGTFLLSNDGRAINGGDLWCIAAAFFSALFILRLEKFAPNNNAAELNAVSFATVATCCSIWVAADALNLGQILLGKSPSTFTPSTSFGSGSDPVSGLGSLTLLQVLQPFLSNPWPALYLGAISTGLCNYLQTIGQREVPAERAAIIYSMDPVYGAFFSWLFLNEQLGALGYAGATLILLGVWVSSAFASFTPTLPKDSIDSVVQADGTSVTELTPLIGVRPMSDDN